MAVIISFHSPNIDIKRMELKNKFEDVHYVHSVFRQQLHFDLMYNVVQ